MGYVALKEHTNVQGNEFKISFHFMTLSCLGSFPFPQMFLPPEITLLRQRQRSIPNEPQTTTKHILSNSSPHLSCLFHQNLNEYTKLPKKWSRTLGFENKIKWSGRSNPKSVFRGLDRRLKCYIMVKVLQQGHGVWMTYLQGRDFPSSLLKVKLMKVQRRPKNWSGMCLNLLLLFAATFSPSSSWDSSL